MEVQIGNVEQGTFIVNSIIRRWVDFEAKPDWVHSTTTTWGTCVRLGWMALPDLTDRPPP